METTKELLKSKDTDTVICRYLLENHGRFPSEYLALNDTERGIIAALIVDIGETNRRLMKRSCG